MHALYAPIRQELDEVEGILLGELTSRFPFVDRLVKHGFRLGGKRLRPALVLLSGKACGRLEPSHVTLAAVVEMIHTATLIHDDVLDEATIRRHLDTVNARWDNEASVLLGDFLFTCAISMASSLESTFACRAIGEAGKTMCEGELRQIQTRGDYDLSEEEYIDIIAGKTAALCACCCRMGAHYAGADPERAEAYAQFGQNLGIAFQIVDDVLDLLGDEATTGKSLGTDLLKEKPTLPLIRLLSVLDDQPRAELVAVLSRPEARHREALKIELERSDAISYAREKAISFARQATEALPSPLSSPADHTLRQLAEFVVARQQ
ncbi:MAG: polyprenyl synthetase family protein [Planctomycetes bacterium]|nr:polyprenyl synthetase family protein [Planctomycetota bacterium]